MVAGGKKTEFLAILGEHGGKNVSTVPEGNREACLEALEEVFGCKLSEIED
jgi:hypothetical protein